MTRNRDVHSIGARMRAARERLAWTQTDLANAISVRVSTVSFWENDKSTPSATQLAAAARALGVSADELLGLLPDEESPVRAYRAGLRDGLVRGEVALRDLRREYEPGEATESNGDRNGVRRAVDRARDLLGPSGADERDAC
jgi:transcriptional regulator with XRE-family HTH domain